MLKALSLTQPWASLVWCSAKRIETRSWHTLWRGELAIHAAKVFPADCQQICSVEPFARVLRRFGLVYDVETRQGKATRLGLPTGAIVAVCKLSGCVATEELLELGVVPDLERALGDFSPRRYGFLLEEIQPLYEPVVCRGSLQIWDVDREVEEEVRAQVRQTQEIAARKAAGRSVVFG